MILATFDAMQGRLTQEKHAPYSIHFKEDTNIIRCQTVSHLSFVPPEASIGRFRRAFRETQKNRLSSDSSQGVVRHKRPKQQQNRFAKMATNTLYCFGWQISRQTTEI
jgi:hypothetical protein